MRPNKPREITCCFSGHRSAKLPWAANERDSRCRELTNRIRDSIEAVYHSGVRHFICGMAEGCDLLFCQEVITLREYRTDITIEAAIPCEGQCRTWSEIDRNRYFNLVSDCDYETLLQTSYTRDCMIKRNMYMVDNSSILIAVFDGTLGGTMQTVNYAKKQKLEIIRLKP